MLADPGNTPLIDLSEL